MKESHRKDPASHPDPESCVEGREATGEALTGAHAGQRRSEGKPETFNFLGFTHLCARSRDHARFLVRRKTMSKRLRAKLQEIKQALLQRRHSSIPEQGAWLRAVVRGYFNYHAIPGNFAALEAFRTQAVRYWRFALRRRSQRSRMNWKRFGKLADFWIPKPTILHPHPNVRFDAKHPR